MKAHPLNLFVNSVNESVFTLGIIFLFIKFIQQHKGAVKNENESQN